MHRLKSVEKGIVSTTCGAKVKKTQATAWESEVTCQDCGTRKQSRACEEPPIRDTLITPRTESPTTKKEEIIMARDHVLTLDQELAEQVVKLRDDEGLKWNEVHERLGVATGKLMLHYSWAKLTPKERVKNATSEDIVRLRADGLSWGDISIRTGINENACRNMFEEASGSSARGNRIGKGGRHPGEASAAEKPKKGPVAAKKAPAKKAAPAKASLFEDMTPDEVIDRITGYAIKVNIDGAETPIKVKSVKKVASGKALIVDAETGASRTIKLDAVSVISKKKVA